MGAVVVDGGGGRQLEECAAIMANGSGQLTQSCDHTGHVIGTTRCMVVRSSQGAATAPTVHTKQ